MNEEGAMMQATASDRWQQVLAYPFRDPKWGNKLLMGSAVLFAGFIVPVVPWLFVMGYFARILRQTIADGEWRLPEWDEWGQMLGDGLRLFGVSLVYSLPAIVLMVVAFGLWLAPTFMPFFAPTADESQVGTWVAGMFGAMALSWVVMGLAMLLMLVALLFQPPAMAHMVAKGSFGAAFRVREWWRIVRASRAGFALAYVIVLGLGMVAYSATTALYMTLVLCFLMPFVLAPLEVYVVTIAGAVFGEAYRTGANRLISDEQPALDPGNG
jgi:hypothetical protein